MRPDSLPWIFTGGFGAFAILVAAAETAGLGPLPTTALLLAGTVAGVTWAGLARPGLPLPAAGMAAGIAWTGGAFLLALPGILFGAALDGLALLIGTALGIGLLAAGRAQAETARGAAATVMTLALLLLAAANLGAVARVLELLLGLGHLPATGLALAALLVVFLPAGAAADGNRRTAQYIVALLAILVPVVVVGARFTGMPVPQIALVELMRRILETERAAGPGAASFLHGQDPLGLLLLAGSMTLGLIALPALTGPGGEGARGRARWGLLFGAVLLATIPVHAALMRSEIDGNVLGRTVAALPVWVGAWSQADRGLIAVCDQPGAPRCEGAAGNADGLVQAGELRLQPDVVLLAAADLGTLPPVLTALIAAGVLAAGLATAGTGLRSMPFAAAGGRTWLVIGAVLAAALAAAAIASPFRLALFAFVLAGSALGPRAFAGRGGTDSAGILAGAAVCIALVGAFEFAGPSMHAALGELAPLAVRDGRQVALPFGYDNIAFGILGALAGSVAGFAARRVRRP